MTHSEMLHPSETVAEGAPDNGEPMATLSELAAMFRVSVRAMHLVFDREPRAPIRFLRRKPARETLYAVSDVRALVDAQRAWLDERRRQAEHLEATQRAARVERRDANIARSEARHKARAAGRDGKPRSEGQRGSYPLGRARPARP